MKSSDNRFFTNKNYNLYHITENNILIVEGKGTIRLELAQEAWHKAMDKAVEFKISKWVVDGSAIELINPKANEWLSKELFPILTEKLNFPEKRLTANVLPARFYAEMNSKDLMSKRLEQDAKAGAQTIERVFQNFKNFDEAYQWITNYKK